MSNAFQVEHILMRRFNGMSCVRVYLLFELKNENKYIREDQVIEKSSQVEGGKYSSKWKLS